MAVNPQKPDPEDEIARLAARVREGDAQGLETLSQRAGHGEDAAVEALFVLLSEGAPGALDAVVSLALIDQNLPARERLFEHLRSLLKQWASGLLRDQPSDFSDLAQSCIFRFLRREADLSDLSGKELLAYIRRMALNWASDRKREEDRRRQVLQGAGAPSLASSASSVQAKDQTQEAISNLDFEVWISPLSTEEKAIVRMRFQEGLSFEEIRRRLDLSSSADAVRVKLVRILGRLGRDPRTE